MSEKLEAAADMVSGICGTAARQAIAEERGDDAGAAREVETLRKQAKTVLEYIHGGYVPEVYVNTVASEVGGVIDANAKQQRSE